MWTLTKMQSWLMKNFSNPELFDGSDETCIAWNFGRRAHPWKKYSKKNELGQFMIRPVKQLRLFKPLSREYVHKYPMGIYVIPECIGDTFLVFPKKVDAFTHIFADHFSFMKNADAITNIHKTMYNPTDNAANKPLGLKGNSFRISKNYNEPLTLSKDSIESDFGGDGTMLYDFMQYCLSLTPTRLNRAKKGRSQVEMQTVDLEPREPQGFPFAKDLCETWEQLKIDQIWVVGIRCATGGYDMTAIVYDKNEWPSGFAATMGGFAFHSNSKPTSSDIVREIRSWLRNPKLHPHPYVYSIFDD